MFTGLVEEVGAVVGVNALARSSRLRIAAKGVLAELEQGDSIAVDGVCLTALDIDGDAFSADVSPETIARSNVALYRIGTAVNLERPLCVGQRLGGHFVQGHVDGVTRVVRTLEEEDFLRVTFEIPVGLRAYLVPKGSVSVNGVSLTVASIEDRSFDVQLVPHTLEQTNLTAEDRCETLNLEVDILGKYVAQLLNHEHEVGLTAEGPEGPGAG